MSKLSSLNSDDFIGEWSTKTNKPHGRGIIINKYGIYIGYGNNGVWSGKYIYIWNYGDVAVGERTEDANGRRHDKYMSYNADGTSR